MTAFSDRLRKNYRKLKPLADRVGTEAYRLYERDIPEYPFLIDLYQSTALISDRREDIDFKPSRGDTLLEVVQALSDELEITDTIVRTRRRLRTESANDQYEKLDNQQRLLTVRESQARFLVNLTDYLDTGLFLDHRKVRQLIFEKTKHAKTFLNLFSYTGSASVFAALGGAKTVSVDLSKTYTEWAQENFKVNNLALTGHAFIAEDALTYLNQKPKRFDFIFFDPPTFSNSKKMEGHWDVQQHHLHVLTRLRDWLTPNGELLFSNNLRTFRLSHEITEHYTVQNLTRATLPFDFRDEKLRHVFLLKPKPSS